MKENKSSSLEETFKKLGIRYTKARKDRIRDKRWEGALKEYNKRFGKLISGGTSDA
jgi:hypothetical protein